MKTGEATKWDRTFGFIDEDVFVHFKDIVTDGYKKLEVGQIYNYDLVIENGSKRATNVKKALKPANQNILNWLNGDNFGGF